MSRINNINKYNYDTVTSLKDSLIGSDFDNGGKTKNFKLLNILNLFNSSNGISSVFYTYDDEASTLNTLVTGVFTSDTNIFMNTLTLTLSNVSSDGINMESFFTNLNNVKGEVVIKLYEPSNVNNYIYTKIENIIIDNNDNIVITVDSSFLSLYEGNFINSIYVFDLYIVNKGSNKTSDLINDGEDGINPYVTQTELKRIEVNTSRNYQTTDYGAILMITANVTLTLDPTLLQEDFHCEVDVIGDFILTNNVANGVVVTPLLTSTLEKDKMQTIYRLPKSDNFRIKGENS